jgi:thiol-disulfide isomerase/thioredoxin
MKPYLPLALAALALTSVAFAENQQGAAVGSKPAAIGDQKSDFQVRNQAVMTALREATKGGFAAWLVEAEKQGREMIKDFPDNPAAYEWLTVAAQCAEPEKARAILKELDTDKVPDAVRSAVQAELAKLDMVGKPLDMKFTAVDGREVDVASMKGKVVLVDFWATWCGPCVGEIPHVKDAYEKLHSKGFEIVGISFDQDKGKLEGFVKENGMEWPQYFEGKGSGNQFGSKYGIRGIPTMWLVNKKGELTDTNGRADLASKVEKLLAD